MRDAGERVLKMSEIPFRHLWTTPFVNYYQWLLSKLSNCYGVPTGLTVSWKIQKCQKQKIYFYQDLEHLNMRSTGFLRNAGLMISGSVCNLIKYNFFPIEVLDFRWLSIEAALIGPAWGLNSTVHSRFHRFATLSKPVVLNRCSAAKSFRCAPRKSWNTLESICKNSTFHNFHLI